MSDTDRIRFDQAALENHALEYCRKESRLTHELRDLLRAASLCAPPQNAARLRSCINDADRLARYFSKMNDTLIEVGQLVESTSRTMLEHLETADEHMKGLLK